MRSAEDVQRRVRMALELHEAGVAIMRQNLKRRFPHETDAQIDRRLGAWLSERPGARHGDGAGTPRR